MKSGIYKITNEVTGKFYIGSAKDIDWRWHEHTRDLKKNCHCNLKLQHSWNFYGENKFKFTILEEIEPIKEKLFEREQWYLDNFKPYERLIGYNISPKADGGDNITHHPNRDAFIQKMSQICTGEGNAMFGRTHSEESIKKQKKKAKGRFTLNWFIERYGQVDGLKKYDARRLMLANRPKHIFSHPNNRKGKKSNWAHPNGWLDRRKATEEYLKNHYEELKQMVLSGKYTQRSLSEKLGITRSTLQKHIKKIKDPSEDGSV